jgi:hypothetical protein
MKKRIPHTCDARVPCARARVTPHILVDEKVPSRYTRNTDHDTPPTDPRSTPANSATGHFGCSSYNCPSPSSYRHHHHHMNYSEMSTSQKAESRAQREIYRATTSLNSSTPTATS